MLIPERATDETIQIKSFCAIEVKDAEKGEVEALICIMGVVDKDEDIIRPGAIPDGAKVSMSAYGHSAVYGDAPVGKGQIHIDGNKAVFKGRMFLATSRGRETFETLKEMGADQQWSWGFRILGAEVPTDDEHKQGARRAITKTDTFEVSPVIIGAGHGTRTLAVKGAEIVPPVAASAEAVPLDPAIEAKRLEDERVEADRRSAEVKRAALNSEGDRRFRHPPAGIRERRR